MEQNRTTNYYKKDIPPRYADYMPDQQEAMELVNNSRVTMKQLMQQVLPVGGFHLCTENGQMTNAICCWDPSRVERYKPALYRTFSSIMNAQVIIHEQGVLMVENATVDDLYAFISAQMGAYEAEKYLR